MNPQAANNYQDDWRTDTTGVDYVHIVGVQKASKTIGQVIAREEPSCGRPDKASVDYVCPSNAVERFFSYKTTSGDGTVPVWSAVRPGYTAPGSDVIQVISLSEDDDDNYDHTGMLNNALVRGPIAQSLLLTPSLSSQVHRESLQPDTAFMPSTAISSIPSLIYQVLLIGTSRMTVTDSSNALMWLNTTDPSPTGSVKGVTLLPSGKRAISALLNANRTYSLTYTTGQQPVVVEVKLTRGNETTAAFLYKNNYFHLGNINQIRLDPSTGITPSLVVDTDEDGRFDSAETPTFVVTGTLSQDVTPPSVAMSISRQSGSSLINIKAIDSESGVASTLYSWDGNRYMPYVQPIPIASRAPTLFVIVDDKAGNRLFKQFTLGSSKIFLPILRK